LIPKIVIDTNIYISAIFWGGTPHEVVDLGRSGHILTLNCYRGIKIITAKDFLSMSPV
jgi:predicted nucleic acid-binding protein